MAGRKPKPAAVKKLEGNPGKRKLNTKEPNPGKGMPDCPAWLLPEAKTEWIRLSEKLNQMGVLTEIDRSAFALIDLTLPGKKGEENGVYDQILHLNWAQDYSDTYDGLKVVHYEHLIHQPPI